MIIGIFGTLGGGKTLTLAKQLKELYDTGHKIYTNMESLTFPYTYITKWDLIDIAQHKKEIPSNAAIGWDEITQIMDSRNPNNPINKNMSYFLLQTRKLGKSKYGIYFIYTTQFPRLIDIRLWLITMIKIVTECIEFEGITIIKCKWIIDKLTEQIEFEDNYIGNKYYNLYDTYEYITETE